jgi:hypothetical protein
MLNLKMVGLSVILSFAKNITSNMVKGSSDSLDKAGIAWENRHKARWVKQESPSGARWASNARTWAAIKGNTTPLTGITQGTTRTWDGIKFTGNPQHMRSALQRKKHSDRIEFTYPSTVQERAIATQEGEMGSILIGFQNGRERRFIFNIPARPHTGISREDSEVITRIFGDRVGKALKES